MHGQKAGEANQSKLWDLPSGNALHGITSGRTPIIRPLPGKLDKKHARIYIAIGLLREATVMEWRSYILLLRR
jgi:hypothetical protein